MCDNSMPKYILACVGTCKCDCTLFIDRHVLLTGMMLTDLQKHLTQFIMKFFSKNSKPWTSLKDALHGFSLSFQKYIFRKYRKPTF